MSRMGTLDHEKLDIYQHALAFVAPAQKLADELPGKRGDLGDQLRRAATSIALNIAEGAGEYSPREKARVYRIARPPAGALWRDARPPPATSTSTGRSPSRTCSTR